MSRGFRDNKSTQRGSVLCWLASLSGLIAFVQLMILPHNVSDSRQIIDPLVLFFFCLLLYYNIQITSLKQRLDELEKRSNGKNDVPNNEP